MEQFRKNQIVELTVERYGSEGEGVAHLPDGRVCFVSGALTGETCLVQLLKVGKTAVWGKVQEILTPLSQPENTGLSSFPEVRRMFPAAHEL